MRQLLFVLACPGADELLGNELSRGRHLGIAHDLAQRAAHRVGVLDLARELGAVTPAMQVLAVEYVGRLAERCRLVGRA
jgi:hypothetical protein